MSIDEAMIKTIKRTPKQLSILNDNLLNVYDELTNCFRGNNTDLQTQEPQGNLQNCL